MSKRSGHAWCGIDAGKGHHWAAVVDETGAILWSKKIDNDETAILTALGEILDLADRVRWAVDISGTASALLLALLAAHGQQAVYVPGRTVNRMAGAYRGEAKTDARDAYVIAETARHRQDFAAIEVPAQLAADLALLTAHRSDLVADRVRMINRLRDVLTGVFPALERAFDYSARGADAVAATALERSPGCSPASSEDAPAFGPGRNRTRAEQGRDSRIAVRAIRCPVRTRRVSPPRSIAQLSSSSRWVVACDGRSCSRERRACPMDVPVACVVYRPHGAVG